MSNKKKLAQRLYRWKLEQRPCNTSNVVDKINREIDAMKIGDKIEVVEKGIYLYGTKSEYSGGWMGSSDIKSIEKFEDHFIFETETGVWSAVTAGHNMRDYIGCAIPGPNPCSSFYKQKAPIIR